MREHSAQVQGQGMGGGVGAEGEGEAEGEEQTESMLSKGKVTGLIPKTKRS